MAERRIYVYHKLDKAGNYQGRQHFAVLADAITFAQSQIAALVSYEAEATYMQERGWFKGRKPFDFSALDPAHVAFYLEGHLGLGVTLRLMEEALDDYAAAIGRKDMPRAWDAHRRLILILVEQEKLVEHLEGEVDGG